MYKEPIFLEPVFKERIWGGTKLRSLFNYNIPSKQIGEAWVIAAHPNGSLPYPSYLNVEPLQNK